MGIYLLHDDNWLYEGIAVNMRGVKAFTDRSATLSQSLLWQVMIRPTLLQ